MEPSTNLWFKTLKFSLSFHNAEVKQNDLTGKMKPVLQQNKTLREIVKQIIEFQ